MRLICTLTEKEHVNPYEFSYYLSNQGIENVCEEAEENGQLIYRIWIYEEDHVEKALELCRGYQANPNNPKYKIHSSLPLVHLRPDSYRKNDSNPDEKKTRRRFLSPAPYGRITILILVTVITLFMLAQIQRGTLTPPNIQGLIQAPILSSTEKNLIYDYPYYFVLRDEFFKIYTPEQIEEKKNPTSDALKLLGEIKNTPVWMGIYDLLLNHLRKTQSALNDTSDLFEKIREGELWRLFTPALLHVDLLHIFFNILWLILLGNQIEFRLGSLRYLSLILSTGIISNTAQYIASGPFFMGLSGVVVGMAAFIFARQQLAPWEGYLLNRFTLIFLGIFVVGMFFLQIALFFMQVYGKISLSVGIANTAHLSGAAVGYLLGRLRFFAIRPKS